jgi:hypothetical protein
MSQTTILATCNFTLQAAGPWGGGQLGRPAPPPPPPPLQALVPLHSMICNHCVNTHQPLTSCGARFLTLCAHPR